MFAQAPYDHDDYHCVVDNVDDYLCTACKGTRGGIKATDEVVDPLGRLAHVHAAHLERVNVIRNMIMIMEDLSPRSTAQE